MPDDLRVTPPSAHGVAIYPAGATFGPRNMRDHEFVWMVEGDAEYTWGGATVRAPAGSVVLCRSGATDFFAFDREHRTRHAYFHFNVLALPSDWPPPGEWPLVCSPAEDDILRPLFRYLLTWAGRGDERLCELTVLEMLAAFVTGRVAARQVPADVLPEPVERAYEYIARALESDPARPIRLGDLAGCSGVSPEHLCRLFASATGRSPMETVRLARLDRAAVLLARSNYAVSEIAGALGFSSPFHFSRRFHRVYGCSPRELRSRVRNGETPPVPRLLRLAPEAGS